MGGFVWVAILSVVFLVKGQPLQAGAGLLLVGAAWASVTALAPWKHPGTPYWKLMLGPYALFLASATWAIWSFGGLGAAGLGGWSLLGLLPLLLPLALSGNRRWRDAAPPQDQG